jgi:hypothetical protein
MMELRYLGLKLAAKRNNNYFLIKKDMKSISKTDCSRIDAMVDEDIRPSAKVKNYV